MSTSSSSVSACSRASSPYVQTATTLQSTTTDAERKDKGANKPKNSCGTSPCGVVTGRECGSIQNGDQTRFSFSLLHKRIQKLDADRIQNAAVFIEALQLNTIRINLQRNLKSADGLRGEPQNSGRNIPLSGIDRDVLYAQGCALGFKG